MKNLMAVGAAALMIFAGQSAAAQNVVASNAIGTRGYCNVSWQSMVAKKATGDQTRDQFMRACLTPTTGQKAFDTDYMQAQYVIPAVLIAAGIGVGIYFAVRDNHNNPASP